MEEKNYEVLSDIGQGKINKLYIFIIKKKNIIFKNKIKK
jgi:hypothetical protein